MPKVSVITTLYNYKHYIEECIQSFLDQDFEDSEMIIVDDASKDSPEKVIGGYVGDRIKYIKLKKNKGYSYAKNVGIKASQSDVLVMLDADDLLTHKGISARYEKLMEGYDFVHGPALTYVYRKGKFVKKGRSKMWKQWLHSTKGKGSWRHVHAQGVMLRKDIHTKIGLYDETMRSKSDREMWARIFNRGFKIGWVDENVSFYRTHSAQMHRSREKKRNNKQLQREFGKKVKRRKRNLSGLELLK